MTKRTVTAISAAAYWIGFATLTIGTVQFRQNIMEAGLPAPVYAFLWVNLAAVYSWSLVRWLTVGKHW